MRSRGGSARGSLSSCPCRQSKCSSPQRRCARPRGPAAATPPARSQSGLRAGVASRRSSSRRARCPCAQADTLVTVGDALRVWSLASGGTAGGKVSRQLRQVRRGCPRRGAATGNPFVLLRSVLRRTEPAAEGSAPTPRGPAPIRVVRADDVRGLEPRGHGARGRGHHGRVRCRLRRPGTPRPSPLFSPPRPHCSARGTGPRRSSTAQSQPRSPPRAQAGQLAYQTLPGEREVTDVAWRDRHMFASTAADGSLRLWDLRRGPRPDPPAAGPPARPRRAGSLPAADRASRNGTSRPRAGG